jgi:phthalate 4,5-dioxygenase oxygenase subunit
MLNQHNELLCRIGRETAMGKGMRCFWLPALMSSELPHPNGDPVHVELLGENLVAFRDGEGNVGVLDELCCHRAASLTLGRVEKCGIRCIYHGWLFATDGSVLETPNVADPNFKRRFKARAYPTRESGGLIWVYLGDPVELPQLPDFGFLGSPDDARINTVQVIPCNYLQLMEGVLDSSHLSVLHRSALQAANNSDYRPSTSMDNMGFDAAPRIEAEETDFGLHYAAIRNIDGQLETRVTAFVYPFWVLNPNGDLIHIFVPMTDGKTAFYHVWWDGKTKFGVEPRATQQPKMVGLNEETLSAYGMTRSTVDGPHSMRRANQWRQDRQAVRAGHFTGVASFSQEDAIVCVSGGPIRDRSNDHLSAADAAIILLFRVLLRFARSVSAGGLPLGAKQSVGHVRGINGMLDSGSDWRTLVPRHRPGSASAA